MGLTKLTPIFTAATPLVAAVTTTVAAATHPILFYGKNTSLRSTQMFNERGAKIDGLINIILTNVEADRWRERESFI